MEKQFEKQMEKTSIEGFNGIQRDFGVKGSIGDGGSSFIAREDSRLRGKVICSFPGGEGLDLGTPLCGGDGPAVSGDAIGIEKDLGGHGDYDVGLRDVKPTPGDVGPGGEAIGGSGDVIDDSADFFGAGTGTVIEPGTGHVKGVGEV